MKITVQEAKELIAYLPDKLSWELWNNDNPNDMVEIGDRVLSKARKEHYKFKVLLPLCTERNNRGVALEKVGEIEEAINTYEQNINGEVYVTRHPYDRLLVLYRRAKDYANERRVCLQAIKVLKDEKYTDRLRKIESLCQK